MKPSKMPTNIRAFQVENLPKVTYFPQGLAQISEL